MRCPVRKLRSVIALLLACTCYAAHAGDPGKVLRIAMDHGEIGFDPAMAGDLNSTVVIAGIMEPLLTFDYLARPPRLVPLTATALPEIGDEGRTYTFRLRPGIVFASDPAFGGRRRELVAADYVYAIKRLVDPAQRSPVAFHVAGKIVGLDERAAAATAPGAKFDFDAPVEGLQAVDRYTLRIRLKEADSSFAYVMALPPTSAIAREVVERYADDLPAHPVGTGPYRLKSWTRASKIVLEANPNFRDVTWDFAPGGDPQDGRIAAAMAGRKLPAIGTVEFHVFLEPQVIWLAFLDGKIDLCQVPDAFVPQALRGDTLAPDLARRGVQLSRFLQPAITYTAFNMKDPVIGGTTPEKVALRRAIAMAYNVDEEIKVVRKGSAVKLEMLVPPGVAGHSPAHRSVIEYNPALANQLLDRVGFRRGKDGFRTFPDGTPLALRYATQRDVAGREFGLLWKKAMNAIGVRLTVDQGYYPEQIKAAQACQHQIWTYGWFADYPDGDNFVQLLYGGNVHQSNAACYASPAYDALYLQSRKLPDSPERTRLYEQMARQVEADAPWRLQVASYRVALAQARVVGHKAHPFLYNDYLYVDLADVRR